MRSIDSAAGVGRKLVKGLASAGWGWLSTNGWILAGAAAMWLDAESSGSQAPSLVAVLGGAALARHPFRAPREGGRLGTLLAELLLGFLLLWTIVAYAHGSLELSWKPVGCLLMFAAYWAANRADLHVAPDLSHPLALDDVVAIERTWIQRRRGAMAAGLNEAPPVGLALSGGGIRSASVSFGFTRQLACSGWLRHVDYLSTVSGGGWFGAMLTAAATSPVEGRELIGGAPAPWDRLRRRLESARAFVSIDGRQGATRLGTVLRQLALGFLFNAGLLAFGLALAGLLPLHVGIDGMFREELHGYGNPRPVERMGGWSDSVEAFLVGVLRRLPGDDGGRAAAAVVDSAAPNRAHFLLDSDLHAAALVPGTLLLAAAALAWVLAWPARILGWRAAMATLGFGRGLLPWGVGALLLGGALKAHVLATLFALFLLFRAALAQLGWPLRGLRRTLAAVVLAGLPLLTANGRSNTVWITNGWHCRATQAVAGITNLAPWTYFHVPCPDPFDNLSERWTLPDSGSTEVQHFRVLTAVTAGPVLLVLFMAFGFWVQRNALGLHDFFYRQVARGFLARTSRDPAVWPLEDLDATAEAEGQVVAPLHLLNAAVNLPASNEPRVRRRGADRFEMSPLAVGGPATGWVRTYDYEGRLSLARAAAISGAAVNPQGGQAIGGLAGAALNFLNFRLGTWIRNPRFLGDDRLRSRPLFSPGYLLREWLGTNNENDLALLVSDGGHDDNLGLRALVERGCAVVVVLDAAKDGDFSYGDLAWSLAGLDADWEVEGESPWRRLVPRARVGTGLRIAPAGAIAFQLRHQPSGRVCTIIYAKSVLTPRAAEDPAVSDYAHRSPRFPHEPTADQWFEADQLEAYLGVGRALALDAVELLEAHLSSRRRPDVTPG